jgi:spore coat protein CotH
MRHRPTLGVFWAVAAAAVIGTAGVGAASCQSGAQADGKSGTVSSNAVSTSPTQTSSTSATASAAGGTLFDNSLLHEISVSFSQEDYDAMIEAYRASGTKEWIEATVTIDGVTYQNAGMRLKGNSSIRGLRDGRTGGPGGNVSAARPEGLPWLLRLDKYVEGQNCDGVNELAVRSNVSKTSLNEAVSLELLEMAGLASQRAIATNFTANGSEAVLRLVTDNPDDVWMAENLSAGGALYKAESAGDYSYRGDDPEAYADIFDQEAGTDNADLGPLIDFLDFINNADDATFYSALGERLDVDSFATYLAMEELIGNFDDMDGPGNNSYLYYDPATGRFTVVPWDHNLAFGAMGGNAPGAGGDIPGAGGPRRGPRDKENKLVQRFHVNSELEALYQKRLAELKAQLFESGAGADVLERWMTLLETQASALVDAATIKAEAAKVSSYFSSN